MNSRSYRWRYIICTAADLRFVSSHANEKLTVTQKDDRLMSQFAGKPLCEVSRDPRALFRRLKH